MTIATGILVMVVLTVVGTLSVSIAYAVLAYGRDWWRELLSVHMLPFLFVGLAVGATTLGIGYTAKCSADDALRLSVSDIEYDCNDQLSLILNIDASEFVAAIATNGVSSAALRRLADYLSIDEYTVVGADGRIVDTTSLGAKAGDVFIADEGVQGAYRDLLNGKCVAVREWFRPSVTYPGRVIKYFATVLPQGGFVQIGFLWESFETTFSRFFLPIFEDRIVGKNGFCVVLNEKNTVEVQVPGHPDSKGRSAADIGLTPEQLSKPLGTVFRARLFGTLYRCMCYPEIVAGRRVLAAVPLSERQGPAMLLACGVAIVLLTAFLVFRLVLRKFRRAQAKIDALRAQEESHRAADLALARSIQRAELRTDGTEGDGYRISSLMNAAREVGGDFYDYYELPDGRLVVTVADVSGKGVPAAFFMMKARVTLKSSVHSCASLDSAVANANLRLSRNNPAEMFVTAWVGVYDRRTGALDFVSAGHNPPLVRRRDGSVEWLNAPRAAALGVFEAAKYRSAQTALRPGDRLFLYTDGVTEAMNPAGELFGNDRLEKAVAEGEPSSSDLIPTVSKAVAAFVDGAEQSDDITMLELRL